MYKLSDMVSFYNFDMLWAFCGLHFRILHYDAGNFPCTGKKIDFHKENQTSDNVSPLKIIFYTKMVSTLFALGPPQLSQT